MSDFRARVLNAVRQIPEGETRTYKEVARRAGNPNAARAVGAILKTNYDPAVPCHRVVRSDGTLGGYNRGAERKCILLASESIERSL
ncbi:MAG: MGMT family protein [Candidatus Paceibacterota bacterium]